MLPIELEKLHPYGVFKVLPTQLLNGTPYLKYLEELVSYYTTIPLEGGGFRPINSGKSNLCTQLTVTKIVTAR